MFGLGSIAVVLIILKLANVIDWSWWLITAPWWAAGIFWLFMMVFASFTNKDSK